MRKLRLLALAGLFAAAAAAGQQAPEPKTMNPYIQVATVAGDEHTVRIYFSPACPYSKQYFQFFRNLSRTLPKQETFEYTPLINKGDGVPYALAFLAVRRFHPQYVENFVEASLRGRQDLQLDPRNWVAIDRISRAAGIPESIPRLVDANRDILKKDYERSLVVQHDLKITNTPSVAVAGTYIVTPEFTLGDSAQFSQLVNGVISMVTMTGG